MPKSLVSVLPSVFALLAAALAFAADSARPAVSASPAASPSASPAASKPAESTRASRAARAGPGVRHPEDWQPPAPPAESALRAYASDIHDYFDQDLGAPAIAMVGARNGTFNGKVVVAAGEAIKGIKAACSDLKSAGGDTIPATRIQVRYGKPWDGSFALGRLGNDILLETPPAEVAVARGRAVVPVWVTVGVPKDAKVGDYAGQLAIEAGGKKLAPVPVKIAVRDWTVPDAQDWKTWMEMVESPDAMAIEYSVPMWSAKHLELIARSFKLIGQSGCRMMYVPLICHTNLGNAESYLRWVKKGDKYEPDYTAVDQYLDAAQTNMGNPKIVCFWVWDTWMNPPTGKIVTIQDTDSAYQKQEKAKLAARGEFGAKGVAVTAVDPATGKTELVYLPRYTTPEGKAVWGPVWKTLREKMKARGLEQAMMIGCATDWQPSKEEVTALKELTGDLPWVSASHHCAWLNRKEGGKKAMLGIADVGLTTLALSFEFVINPELGRLYGWKQPLLHPQFWRGGFLMMRNLSSVRHEPECQITGNQSGLARLGGDFWPCVRDKAGRRRGIVTDRWPECYWHNLNILDYFLAPEPDGPASTVRLEMLREGVQECEARIAIESVLTDDAKKAKLGDGLAKKAQAFLDEQQRSVWRAKGATDEDWKYGKVDYSTYDYKIITNWKENAGCQWFIQSGWADRVGQLYGLTQEVTAKAGR